MRKVKLTLEDINKIANRIVEMKEDERPIPKGRGPHYYTANIVDLEDLEGEFELSGVDKDIETVMIDVEWSSGWEREDAQVLKFVLDGETYKAIENPDDRYRSALDRIERSNDKVRNTFPPQKVVGRFKDNGSDRSIQFFDVETNKLVLEIGTEAYDDYYPMVILRWKPQNLAVNKDK